MAFTFMTRFRDVTVALLRIVAGLLFMQHGLQKLFGWLGGFGGQPGATAELFSLMGLAGVLETVGGLLILLGLFTRPVAFVLAGEMAVAYFMAHAPNGIWPIQNGGEPAALFAFIFLFFSANGAGPFSIDQMIGGRTTATGAPGDVHRVHEGAH